MAEHDLRNVLSNYISVKRHACRYGPRDAVLILHARYTDGTSNIATVDDRERITEAARELCDDHEVSWLALLADARRKRLEPGEAGQRGDAHRAFAAGDMTVEDVLVGTLIDADGQVLVATVPYRYDDRGQPKFRPVAIEEHDTEGYVLDALREAMT